jgi:hypothetical protein
MYEKRKKQCNIEVQNCRFCIKKSQNRSTFLPLNKKCIPLRAIFGNDKKLQIKT